MAKVKGLRWNKSRNSFYAALAWMEDGRQRQTNCSLGTRDEQVAIQRLPAALRRLRNKAKGINVPMPLKATDEGITWDSETGLPQVVTAGEVFDPEELQISWPQAVEIHRRRREEATGRPLADETVKVMRLAIRLMDVAPGDVTTKDVRRYLDRCKAQGLQPQTVRKQAAMMQAMTNSLIKGAYLPDDAVNAWSRVDFSSRSRNHRHSASPEECKAIMELGLPQLKLMLYCGWRTTEVNHLNFETGWCELKETADWRPKNDYSVRRLPCPIADGEIASMQMLSRNPLNDRIKKVAPECTSYSLRHAWRTAAREAQIPFDLAEFMFGHANPGGVMAATYGRFSDAAVEQAMKSVWQVLDSWCQ